MTLGTAVISEGAGLDDGDLVFSHSQGWARWQGTRAALLAEGLVPLAIEWPAWRGVVMWEGDRLRFSLQRCRRPGTRGPVSRWSSGDWWACQQVRLDDIADHGARARLAEARQAYDAAVWRETPAGHLMRHNAVRAQGDTAFREFIRVSLSGGER